MYIQIVISKEYFKSLVNKHKTDAPLLCNGILIYIKAFKMSIYL